MRNLGWLLLMPLQLLFGQALECTQLFNPADGATNVPITTLFEWSQVTSATGYRINAGTSSGGLDIFDGFNVGNITSYEFANQLPPEQTIYVTIIPYDDTMENLSCPEVVFTTGTRVLPSCTEIINPQDGDALVSVTANITWIRDFSATGYFMTIYEKDPAGILIWDMVDVGNGTNAQPPEFKPRTRYYVTIIPYNLAGIAPACEPITFTTGDPLPLPDCAELTSPLPNSIQVPLDTDLSWNPVPGSDGYILSVGTAPGGANIVDNLDMGLDTMYDLPNDLPLGTRIYVQIRSIEGARESEICPLTFFDTFRPTTDKLADTIPKFFTPNNDGANDLWTVEEVEDLEIQDVFVFDRYGRLLVQLGPGEGWNGTTNGRALPSGSYWYSVGVLNFPPVKGYLLLKR